MPPGTPPETVPGCITLGASGASAGSGGSGASAASGASGASTACAPSSLGDAVEAAVPGVAESLACGAIAGVEAGLGFFWLDFAAGVAACCAGRNADNGRTTPKVNAAKASAALREADPRGNAG